MGTYGEGMLVQCNLGVYEAQVYDTGIGLVKVVRSVHQV